MKIRHIPFFEEEFLHNILEDCDDSPTNGDEKTKKTQICLYVTSEFTIREECVAFNVFS